MSNSSNNAEITLDPRVQRAINEDVQWLQFVQMRSIERRLSREAAALQASLEWNRKLLSEDLATIDNSIRQWRRSALVRKNVHQAIADNKISRLENERLSRIARFSDEQSKVLGALDQALLDAAKPRPPLEPQVYALVRWQIEVRTH